MDGESVNCTVKGSKSDKDIAVVAVNLSDIKSSTINQISIAELGEERTTQILSDMRTLVEAMEHASKKMHFKEAE